MFLYAAAAVEGLESSFEGCIPGHYAFAVHESAVGGDLTASTRITGTVYGGDGTYLLMSCKTDADEYRASQVLFRSHDGGTTWLQQTLAGMSGRCVSGNVYLPAEDAAYIIAGTTLYQTYGSTRFDRGQTNSIWYTQDHGISWARHDANYVREDGFLAAVAVNDTIFTAHGCCPYRRDVHKWKPGQPWASATSNWGSALGTRCCVGLGLTADERVVVLDGSDQTRSYHWQRDMWISSSQGAAPFSKLFATNKAPFVIERARLIPFSASSWILITRQSASQMAAWCTTDTGANWIRVDSNGDSIPNLDSNVVILPFDRGDIDYKRKRFWMFAGGPRLQTVTLAFAPSSDTSTRENVSKQVHCCLMISNGTVTSCSLCAQTQEKHLNLSSANVTSLSEHAIFSMGSQVESLDLSGNQLSGPGVLASLLSALLQRAVSSSSPSRVTLLNISQCGLSEIPEGMPQLNLSVVDASFNNITALSRRLYADLWCHTNTTKRLCVFLEGNPAVQSKLCPMNTRQHALPSFHFSATSQPSCHVRTRMSSSHTSSICVAADDGINCPGSSDCSGNRNFDSRHIGPHTAAETCMMHAAIRQQEWQVCV